MFRARAPALGLVALCLAVAAYPLERAALGLHEGVTECVGRGCHTLHARAQQPGFYWFDIGFLLVLSVPLVGAALYFAWALVRDWRQLPWRMPLAGRSAKQLRASDQALQEEQSALVDAGLRRMHSGSYIAVALEPLSRKRAEIAVELARRERIRKSLRLPIISCGVLIAGIVAIVAFLVLFGPYLVAR
jgi:hypothetical protein